MVVGGWACGAVAHGAVRSGESGSRAFGGIVVDAGTKAKTTRKYVESRPGIT